MWRIYSEERRGGEFNTNKVKRKHEKQLKVANNLIDEFESIEREIKTSKSKKESYRNNYW